MKDQEHEGWTEKSFGQTAPSLINDKHRRRAPSPIARERPILFSGEMVRAILDGRKTQTRRVGNMRGADRVRWHVGETHAWGAKPPERYEGWVAEVDALKGLLLPLRCPFGQPGDWLWVRETFCPVDDREYGGVVWTDYRATPRYSAEHPAGWDAAPDDAEALKWRPSIFMPRRASRISLEVTGIRVERIQDIGGQDAMAEGVERWEYGYKGAPCTSEVFPTAWTAFRSRWDALNGKRGYGWDANPWVWVIEFRRVGP